MCHRTFTQVVDLNVIHYANNRADGMLLAQSKLLPDGVFARQNLSGHSLTDNYGRRSSYASRNRKSGL